ncbi:MAG TPA: DUF6305 family protein [Atribacterota bacterium]|nr:DUF6305 family protein [Atribacterota bacterium]
MNNRNNKNVLLQLLFILFCVIVLTIPAFSTEVTETPEILITSIGQSPDARMINVLLSRFQIAAAYEQIAYPEMIEDYKIIIAVVGGSSKGLGAAGIDKNEELDRTKSLIEEIKKRKITFLVMHIGGEARRGALSDAFLDLVVPKADHLIIVKAGNEDGYFTKMSTDHKIPLESVEKIADTGELVKNYLEEHLK